MPLNLANDAENRYYALDVDIQRTRSGPRVAAQRRAATCALGRAQRALEAYVSGNNVGIDDLVSGNDVLDAVRRTRVPRPRQRGRATMPSTSSAR